MFKKIFLNHPQSVDESYFQHFIQACTFSFKMFTGGLACLVHAFIPCLCVSTGSKAIVNLHDKMVMNRHKQTSHRKGDNTSHERAA
ncbi:DUF6356 family protein [Kordiimonas pumila]|uniref:DUF6356 family protein n=1 Tax=Kordiimonas pumila TaxID=2161677 RepID=A0ABV7D9H7_9PROT|nr:DUF6356 family protein [Kordiimonas pumila]